MGLSFYGKVLKVIVKILKKKVTENKQCKVHTFSLLIYFNFNKITNVEEKIKIFFKILKFQNMKAKNF